MAFPDGNIPRHENFICVCTGNTTGNESNIQYIGRNILDAATLDRFIRLYVGYSDALEKALLTTEALRIRDIVRGYYEDNDLDEFLSMRSLLQFDKLVSVGFGSREALILACKPEDAVLQLVYEPETSEDELTEYIEFHGLEDGNDVHFTRFGDLCAGKFRHEHGMYYIYRHGDKILINKDNFKRFKIERI
jgi:hypothetical protein